MFKRRSFLLSLALGMSLLMGSAHALTILSLIHISEPTRPY